MTANQIKITRLSSGSYEITAGKFSVFVDRRDDLVGGGWTATATWDRYLYSDPLRTYRDAKHEAIEMIRECVA